MVPPRIATDELVKSEVFSADSTGILGDRYLSQDVPKTLKNISERLHYLFIQNNVLRLNYMYSCLNNLRTVS